MSKRSDMFFSFYFPQLGTVCLAADYHTFDRIYHDALLDVLAGVYVFGTQIE